MQIINLKHIDVFTQIRKNSVKRNFTARLDILAAFLVSDSGALKWINILFVGVCFYAYCAQFLRF